MSNPLEDLRGSFWPGMATHPPEDDEPTFSNPYMDAILATGATLDDLMHPYKVEAERSLNLFTLRHDLTRRYAWAIPNERAIETIADLSPIVEVGAGYGYWAKLISEAGGDIIAFDKEPSPIMHADNGYLDANADPWFPVERGDARKAMAGGRRERTLFLCWPPMSDMAEVALRAHRGEHVVYVGEGAGGCTASEGFFELLEARYEHRTTVSIPQWMGIHDYLEVWKRHG